jgi:hypothetical protein
MDWTFVGDNVSETNHPTNPRPMVPSSRSVARRGRNAITSQRAIWRHGLLLVTALIAGCAPVTPGPTSTPSEPATPGPIEPEAVSVRLARLQGIGPFEPTVTLYESGRLLTLDEQNRLVERRVTPAGSELVRQAMLDTGLFEGSADYVIEIRPGAEPPGMEVPFDRFSLATADGMVVVGSMPFEDPTWIVPSAERDALADLAERLVDLSWLPDEAWATPEPAPYAAAAFLLFGGDLPLVDVDPAAPDMANVAWPFPGSPDQLGRTFVSADGTQSVMDRCLVIGPAARAALNSALAAGGGQGLGSGAMLFGGDYIPWRERGIAVQLELRPLLPEETPTCAGKSLPPSLDL